ncbi:cytochrome P450 monooxygenase E-class group I [Fusarium phyllophilum]|uniref:Cytochrome P450 monooxygenase E-class group I n=1 Tax=Fusarium phyllophilum TaxID=47803 RepID=A0A8H5JYY6_9HYPO|nr:cytochrome P450 monooxygenase E-class group I [Fusarium phyllophilum]
MIRNLQGVVSLPSWDMPMSHMKTHWLPYAIRISRSITPPPLLIILLLAALSPVIGYVVYYAFFHPLAKYPGPFWGKFTGLRAAYHAWIGDVHIDMWKCHEKYGPYVRYSPNYLLMNTTQAYKDVYGHNKNVRKSLAYLAMVHKTPSTFTLMDRHEHAWKKRILSQKLSDSAIRSFEPKITGMIDRFCEYVCPASTTKENTVSKPFNMSEMCDYLFFDLVTSIVFGENFDLIRSPWYRHIPPALARSNERISVIVQWPYVVWRRMDKVLFRNSVAGRKDFLRFAHNLVTERVQRGSGDDVLSGLLDAADPTTGNKLTQDEIVAESILMLVAGEYPSVKICAQLTSSGSDTSSTLLASLFFYLTRNPDKKDRLTREVRSKFSTREEICLGPALNSCRFLHACIMECLRLTPPVAAAPFREVLKGGMVVDGHYVPEGTNVGTGLFSIQHNQDYFYSPFEFIPERWLSEGKHSGPHNPDAHVPFSIGPRVCLGRALAHAELSLAMAIICWKMDFNVVESMKDIGAGNENAEYGRHRPGEFQLYDHITCARNGPMVEFRERSF